MIKKKVAKHETSFSMHTKKTTDLNKNAEYYENSIDSKLPIKKSKVDIVGNSTEIEFNSSSTHPNAPVKKTSRIVNNKSTISQSYLARSAHSNAPIKKTSSLNRKSPSTKHNLPLAHPNAFVKKTSSYTTPETKVSSTNIFNNPKLEIKIPENLSPEDLLRITSRNNPRSADAKKRTMYSDTDKLQLQKKIKETTPKKTKSVYLRINNLEFSPQEIPTTKYWKEHEISPFIVKEVDGKGRGLFTNIDIEPGQVIGYYYVNQRKLNQEKKQFLYTETNLSSQYLLRDKNNNVYSPDTSIPEFNKKSPNGSINSLNGNKKVLKNTLGIFDSIEDFKKPFSLMYLCNTGNKVLDAKEDKFLQENDELGFRNLSNCRKIFVNDIDNVELIELPTTNSSSMQIVFAMKTTQVILKGDEILCDYGEDYTRNLNITTTELSSSERNQLIKVEWEKENMLSATEYNSDHYIFGLDFPQDISNIEMNAISFKVVNLRTSLPLKQSNNQSYKEAKKIIKKFEEYFNYLYPNLNSTNIVSQEWNIKNIFQINRNTFEHLNKDKKELIPINYATEQEIKNLLLNISQFLNPDQHVTNEEIETHTLCENIKKEFKLLQSKEWSVPKNYYFAIFKDGLYPCYLTNENSVIYKDNSESLKRNSETWVQNGIYKLDQKNIIEFENSSNNNAEIKQLKQKLKDQLPKNLLQSFDYIFNHY